MLNKLIQHHKNHPAFLTVKSQAAKQFGVVHFAGSVFYTATGRYCLEPSPVMENSNEMSSAIQLFIIWRNV